MSAGAIYFLVVGPVVACLGVALLVDFKGLGRRWENELNRSAGNVAKIFGWQPNRYWGSTYRPFAGGIFVFVGVALLMAVVTRLIP